MKAEKSTKSNCSYNSLSSAPISSMMSVLPLLLMACLLMCPQLPVDGTPPPVKSVFVLQPRPIYYIVRDSAVSVECEALHVAKLAIKCNGDFVQVSKYSLTHNQEKDTEKISISEYLHMYCFWLPFFLLIAQQVAKNELFFRNLKHSQMLYS